MTTSLHLIWTSFLLNSLKFFLVAVKIVIPLQKILEIKIATPSPLVPHPHPFLPAPPPPLFFNSL